MGLRPRIAIVAALTVGVALAIGASVVLALLRSQLDDATTTADTLRARDVASLATAGTLPRRLALPGEESALVQVVDASGTVMASTEIIDGQPVTVYVGESLKRAVETANSITAALILGLPAIVAIAAGVTR